MNRDFNVALYVQSLGLLFLWLVMCMGFVGKVADTTAANGDSLVHCQPLPNSCQA